MLCCDMRCDVMVCVVMLCIVMLCRAMICWGILCGGYGIGVARVWSYECVYGIVWLRMLRSYGSCSGGMLCYDS